MAGITIRDLGPQYSWGSVVDGVTRANVNDPALRAQLKQLFIDRAFIHFENVEPSSQLQVDISTIFGPIKDHPTKHTKRAAEDLAPGVIDMHYPPREEGDIQGLVEIDGEKLVSYAPWHFDHCYNDEVNYCGVLRAVVSAPEKGRTGFCDGVELYKSFNKDLLARLEGLNVIYTLDVRLSQQRFGRIFKTFGDLPMHVGNVEEAKTFPRAIHPAVQTLPSGEKCLHFGPWMAVGIEGHEDPEGDALFEACCQELIRCANAYWHDWKPTDMLVWDNIRTLHAVEGCNPKYERRMQRTTVRGDYMNTGRFEGGKRPGEVYRELAPVELA